MPDQTLLWVTFHHTVHNLVRGEILLVTADDLDPSVFLVGGKEREVLQNIQHHLWPEHTRYRRLDVVELTFLLVFVIAPGSPHIDGHPDRPVTEQSAFARDFYPTRTAASSVRHTNVDLRRDP